MRTSKKQRELPRHGSIYIAVTGVAMILSLIGLTAMQISRLELRTTTNLQNQNYARIQAISAAELALAQTDRYADWRTRYTHGVEKVMNANNNFGALYFKYLDHVDGDLGNNTTDPVEVQGIGRIGGATFVYSVDYQASVGPAQQVAAVIHSYEGGWSTFEVVDDNAFRGQHFIATLPAGATSWSITQVEVFVSGDKATGGSVNINLYLSDGGGIPSTLLETVAVAEPALPAEGSYDWHPVNFSSVTGLTPGVGLCLTVEGVGGGTDARIPYDNSVTQTDSHFLRGASGSWNTNSGQSMQFRIHGVYTTSVGTGPFTVAPGSWRSTTAN